MILYSYQYSVCLLVITFIRISPATSQTIRFTAETYTVFEDGSTVNVCVETAISCSRDRYCTASFTVSTVGASAIQNTDFVALSRSFRNNAGGEDTYVLEYFTNCVSIFILNDETYEDTETFNVTVGTGQLIRDNATVNIIDNDNVTVSMRESSLIRTEGDGSISVCAEVTSPIGGLGIPVEVRFTQSGQSPASRIFSVGGASVQCLSVSNDDDQIFEDATTFTVTLSSTQSRVTATGMTTVTIMDNDDVTVSMRDRTLTRTEGDGSISVCAEVTSPTGGLGIPVEVRFTQSGQSPVTKTFSGGGDRVELQCLSVSNEDDQMFEDATTFTVTLSSTQSRVTATGMTTVTIMDNDDVTVSMQDRTLTQTEGDSNISVCAEVTSPTGGLGIPVEVRFTPSGQSPATRTFSVGRGRIQCLNFSNEDDQIFEDATTFTVTLSSTQNRVTATGMTTVTIMDNDDVTVSLTNSSSLTRTEGDGSIRVCAEVNHPREQLGIPVEVRFTQSGQSPVTRNFSFTREDVLNQCLSISNEDDHVFEDATTFTVTLSSTQSRVTATGNTIVTIMDNDDPVIGFVQPSYTVQEGRDEIVSVCVRLLGPVGGLSREITVTLSATARLSAELGVDYEANDYTVTRTFQTYVTVGSTYQRCFNPSIVDDTIAESSESFTVSLTPSESRVRINGSNVASVTILDNDVITIGMEQSLITQSESAGDVMVCAVLNGPAGGLEGKNAVIQLTPTGYQSVTRTFQSGSRVGSRQCIILTVTDDETFEDDETITVSLSASQNMVTATGRTTVTITDDNDPVVGLVQSSYTVREGTDEMVSVCAELLGPSGGLAREFTVTLSAHNGTAEPERDYSVTEYLVTRTFRTYFTVGSQHLRCFRLNIINDNIGETEEHLTISLSSSNSRVVIENGRAVAAVIIIDDDVVPNLTPQSFQVSATGSRSLSFSWRAPNNPSQTIVGYNVSCSSSGERVFFRGYMNPGSYEGTGFLPYTNYTCRVFATVMGNIGEDITRTVLTHEEAPGSPPKSVNIQDSTSSSITLSWQPPVLSYGVITNYNLYINYTNGSEIERRETPSATYTITQLFPYQNVTVEISAQNSAGEGRLLSIVSARTRESNPDLVREVEFSALDETILVVTWMPPKRPNGELLYYIVRLHSPVNMDSYLEVNTTMLSAQWTELEPYIPYNVSVLAVNSAGDGQVYRFDYVFTEEGIPNTVVSNVTVERLSGDKMSVSWKPLSLIEARGRVTNYTIYYWKEGTDISTALLLNVSGDTTTVTITGLDATQSYLVSVAASTIAGMGNQTEPTVIHLLTESDTNIGAFVGGGGGVAFAVFLSMLIVITGVVLWGYRRRKRHNFNIPNDEGNDNKTISSAVYEIPLPIRRHVDAVPTKKCVAYGIPVNTGRAAIPRAREYEFEVPVNVYETIT